MAPPRILTHRVNIATADASQVVNCMWCRKRLAAIVYLSRPDELFPHLVFPEGWFYDLDAAVMRMSRNARYRMGRGEKSRDFPIGPRERTLSVKPNELVVITQKHDGSRYERVTTPLAVLCSCGRRTLMESAVALDTARPVRTIRVDE